MAKETTPQQENLTQKLAKIRKMTEVVEKDKAGYSYRYVSAAELLAHVTAGMNKYHVSLVPSIVPGTTSVTPYSYDKTKVLKDGKTLTETVNEILVSAQVNYRWTDDDSGEFSDVPWFITGSQADPSQALGGALSYSLRYFFINFFQVATLDNSDPDVWRDKQKHAEETEDRAVASQIIDTLDTKLKAYLAENADKRKEVLAVVTKYVKGGNYRTIEDPKTAAALYQDITETFFGTKEE